MTWQGRSWAEEYVDMKRKLILWGECEADADADARYWADLVTRVSMTNDTTQDDECNA